MNILQVNKFFYRRGGAEHHLFDLSELLSGHGHKVLFFSMLDEANEKSEYSRYFISQADFASAANNSLRQKIKNIGRMFYSFAARRKIRQLLADNEVDLVHLHNIYHHISPSILPTIKERGLPIVMTLHDYKLLCPNYTFYHHGQIHEEDGRGWYFSCVRNKCLNDSFLDSLLVTLEMIFHHKIKSIYEKNVDLFIAPSQFVKDVFVRFGWDEQKIILLEHFLPLGFEIKDRATELPRERKFIYVGRLAPEKGVDKLIKYWVAHRIKATLDVFGDGPLLSDLKLWAKSQKNIVLHGRRDRADIYKNSDKYTAMIVPTEFYEPFGLVVLEAMANGLPIVASGRGALKGLIEKSQAGLIFSWNGANTLEEQLDKIDNREYRENALRYIKKNHGPENYYHKLLEIYNRLATK